MPDIFDEIAPEISAPVKGDIFDKLSPEKELSGYQSFKKGEQELLDNIIEYAGRPVKGMATAAGHFPASVASFIPNILNLLTMGKVPGLPQIASYLDQPLAWEDALKRQLEKTIPVPETYGEQTSEKGGQQLFNFLSFGVKPQAAIPGVLGGLGAETTAEMAYPQMSEEAKGAFGLLGQLPGLLHGEFATTTKPSVSKSGLELPQIAEKEYKYLPPKVLPGKKEKIMGKLAQDATKLTEEIKKREIPIAKEIEQGIDVEARNEANFEKVNNIAKKLPDKYETNFISDYLNNVTDEINKVVPTEEQEDILKLAEKFRKRYGELPGGKRFYSAEDNLDQFRRINKDLKKLYQTKFVHGESLDTMHFYEGLKNAIKQTFDTYAPKEFSNLFKETNKDFSSITKLNKFDLLMQSVSDEKGALVPSKLDKFIKNSKKQDLLRQQIGVQGLEDLKDISQDLSKAEKNLGLLKSPSFTDILSTHTANALLNFLSIPIVAPVKMTKEALEYARGFMLTRPQGKKDVVNLLRAIRSGKEKVIKASLLKLDEDARQYEEENPID